MSANLSPLSCDGNAVGCLGILGGLLSHRGLPRLRRGLRNPVTINVLRWRSLAHGAVAGYRYRGCRLSSFAGYRNGRLATLLPGRTLTRNGGQIQVTLGPGFPALDLQGGANFVWILRLIWAALHLQDVVQVLGDPLGITVQSVSVTATLLEQQKPVCRGEAAGEASRSLARFGLSGRGRRQQHGCVESEYREENFHGPTH